MTEGAIATNSLTFVWAVLDEEKDYDDVNADDDDVDADDDDVDADEERGVVR